jgi:hypothetical protein
MKCVFYVGEKFLEVGAMLYLFGFYYVCVFLKKIIYYELFIIYFCLSIIFPKVKITKFVFFCFLFVFLLFLFYFFYLCFVFFFYFLFFVFDLFFFLLYRWKFLNFIVLKGIRKYVATKKFIRKFRGLNS